MSWPNRDGGANAHACFWWGEVPPEPDKSDSRGFMKKHEALLSVQPTIVRRSQVSRARVEPRLTKTTNAEAIPPSGRSGKQPGFQNKPASGTTNDKLPRKVSWTCVLLGLSFFLLLAGCGPESDTPTRLSGLGPGVTPVTNLEERARAIGERVYLPVYSHIYSSNQADPINLAVTVCVRNTDASTPIQLRQVSYHGSDGKLIREYLTQPVQIAPLAAAEFFVPESDTHGGSMASFLIDWQAETLVDTPVAEAVHANTLSGLGMVFTTWGRPLGTGAMKP